MLYDPSAHEHLVDAPWDAEHARVGIRAIVDDAVTAADPRTLWPAHEWDAWTATPPLANLYVGAAGVVFALDELERSGRADVPLDLAALALRALERWREQPEYSTWPIPVPEQARHALFLGESGPLLVAAQLTNERTLADELHAHVLANVEHDENELFWGTPGTMLAAALMQRATGEVRWRDAVDASVNAILSRRRDDGLWTQNLLGTRAPRLSASHGFPGVVQALAAVDADVPGAGDVMARHAVREDGGATWPRRVGAELRAEDGEIRVQWDEGAPGVVAALAGALDEELALEAGELVWRAGPLRKGPSLCHGTAGNGLAFLKLFRRTGDERWLERARMFAMHALAQVEREPPRYSLWTGGVGVALYLARCLDGDASVPLLD